ncbi:endonuclease [Saprospira grandis]|uniref:endonuclease n=1 Tax=Saprospira grandis TaxID=1008 RepID=UPI0022DE21FC|nr:endonuclease [Saprospira grandis]WBM74191.1 endonuclease [Saprospira grandis]
MKRLIYCMIFLGAGPILWGQHQDVFPGLSTADLLDSVQLHYRPDTVLAWNNAKDTLFKVIDNQNDTVTCVYTGLQKWLDPTQDPDSYMSDNNAPNGMNVEHTYPQSRGAANGNARSDLHHLFACRNETNNMRGNLPFAELADTAVTNWFYLTYNAQGVPVFDRDNYSELVMNQAFEPREDFKGNVARAMFYFYTIYRNEAQGSDPNFFGPQQAVLCDWHELDPVDQAEWDRSQLIATYQDGKANPFVLDCSLAKRLYCPNQAAGCAPSALAVLGSSLGEAKLWPNPLSGNQLNLSIHLLEAQPIELELLDVLGRSLGILETANLSAGDYQWQFDLPTDLAKGVYLLRIRAGGSQQSLKFVRQ